MLYHDDYLLIRDELSIEQKGRLLDEIMSYSLQIRDRKMYTDDDVECIEPAIETDDTKLKIYFKVLAQKVNRDEQEYRYRSKLNSENRRKAIEKAKGVK